jgi:hypothetical protein
MLIKGESQKVNIKRRRNLHTSALLFLFSFFYSITANAQCAMCRAALESEGNTAKAKGINDGIVYLMVFPYILIGLAFFAVYKMYKKKIK